MPFCNRCGVKTNALGKILVLKLWLCRDCVNTFEEWMENPPKK